MNRLFLLFVFAFAALGVAAQQRGVYAEWYGASNGLSANFDSRLAPYSHWGFNAGFGYSNDTYSEYHRYSLYHLSMPLRLYYLTGKRNHHFEIGAGVVPGFVHYTERSSIIEEQRKEHFEADYSQFRYYFTMNMGYCYQMPHGFLLRTGLCLNAYDRGNNDGILGNMQPYLALGYSF